MAQHGPSHPQAGAPIGAQEGNVIQLQEGEKTTPLFLMRWGRWGRETPTNSPNSLGEHTLFCKNRYSVLYLLHKCNTKEGFKWATE